ncbi:mediator of RNA polymerase II transcription subunit 6-like [Anneissia japonica]|uniref:mediator of RNA polymerase II transcription subunit 6-like n=1 Tax=Anneissia japonica TaxID=1529436 RepID=UPI001425806D|nr:mediator of RNA polymerase II transcription subunit 6-like [Anneissia japonica]
MSGNSSNNSRYQNQGNDVTEDNPLHMTWHDSAWIPLLDPSNVMNYFSERSNPFYDRKCNNEIVKMQRQNPEQLINMIGLEYQLLHVHDPILYVIRKQHRFSPTNVTPLADYYIIAGVIYQAPDLCSVLNARMLTAAFNIQSAFEETLSFSRYKSSCGYWWEFKDKAKQEKEKKKPKKEEPASMFQRQKVDVLLSKLADRFPPKVVQPKPGEKPIVMEHKHTPEFIDTSNIKEEKGENHSGSGSGDGFVSPGSNIKPPLAKKRKLSK